MTTTATVPATGGAFDMSAVITDGNFDAGIPIRWNGQLYYVPAVIDIAGP